MSDLVVLTLRPLADPDGVDRRLRFALKRLLRWDKLQCVSVVSGPEAWVGWIWNEDRGWLRACTGVSPRVVLNLLSESAAEGTTVVLLAGVMP